MAGQRSDTELEDETWLLVEGYESHEVSDRGRVMRVDGMVYASAAEARPSG